MPLWSNTNTNASKPKFLLSVDKHYNNANCYGVNIARTEVANVSNHVYFPAHQGWVQIQPEYTDTCGFKRHKCETLVVMNTQISGGNANIAISGAGSTANSLLNAGVTASVTALNAFAVMTSVPNLFITPTQFLKISNATISVTAISASGNITLNAAPNFAGTLLQVSDANTGTIYPVDAALVAANGFSLLSTNVARIFVNGSAVSIGNNAYILSNVRAANTNNVGINVAPNFTNASLAVNFTGANTIITGNAASRYNFELKVGDIITIVNLANTISKVVAIVNANAIQVNTTFTTVNTGLQLFVGSLPWFPLV
jgi:hypothetical protein